MPITAGPVTPGEVAAAHEVWRRANTARGKAPSERRIARIAAKLGEPSALVVAARDAGTVVGMALAEPGRDRDGDGDPVPGLCHLSMVFVDPDRWGRGVGKVLLSAVSRLATSSGYAAVQLWTGQGNQRARRLYEGAGFRPSGREQRLDTGEIAIHLVSPLPL